MSALPFLWKALACFAVTACLSVFWALYFRFSTERKPLAAANADLMIVLVSAFNVIGFTQDRRLLLPYFLGSWLGTYIAVRRKKPAP